MLWYCYTQISSVTYRKNSSFSKKTNKIKAESNNNFTKNDTDKNSGFSSKLHSNIRFEDE